MYVNCESWGVVTFEPLLGIDLVTDFAVNEWWWWSLGWAGTIPIVVLCVCVFSVVKVDGELNECVAAAMCSFLGGSKWFQKLLDMLTLKRLISLPHTNGSHTQHPQPLLQLYLRTNQTINFKHICGIFKKRSPAALLEGPSHQTNKCQAHGLEIGMTTMPMMSKQQWDSILWSYFCLHKVLTRVLGISLLQRKNWWVRFG